MFFWGVEIPFFDYCVAWFQFFHFNYYGLHCELVLLVNSKR